MELNTTRPGRIPIAVFAFKSFISSLRKTKMAFSQLKPKVTHHVRSNSLPSKPHPLISEVDDHLCRLKASKTSSSSSICHKLSGLQDLHDCIDKLLLLPLTQQTLIQERNKEWVDELLEGSLRLLDLCGVAKEALLQTKECTNDLQSVLRRKKGDEMEIAIRKWLKSRNIVKKAIVKALKRMDSKHVTKNHELQAIVRTLREVEAFTFSALEQLLSFVAGSKSPSKLNGWSLVSKLVHSKRVACNDQKTNKNELETVDAALRSITNQKITTNSECIVQVESLQNFLGNSESCIQDLEEDLERLYRNLIRTRVSLLNIFNN